MIVQELQMLGATNFIITHKSDTFTAGAGQTITPLGSIKVPVGAKYFLVNPFKFNALKLFADGGAEIPADSYIYIFRRGPDQDWGEHLRKISYAPYYDLTEAQQRDDRFFSSLYIDMNYDSEGRRIDALEFTQEFSIEFYVKSSVAVDLTEPATRFELPVGRKAM
jgi:hypothetical protein